MDRKQLLATFAIFIRESCSRKRCFQVSFRAILRKFRKISHRDKDYKATIYTEDNKFHQEFK